MIERTRIRDGPEDYQVAAGQTATFRCTAVADSSLDLSIEWLHEGELIDFEQQPRFVQSQDQSLTITKTTELDTGDYMCRAKTVLDDASDSATLIVQGALLLFFVEIRHSTTTNKHNVLEKGLLARKDDSRLLLPIDHLDINQWFEKSLVVSKRQDFK